jgi:microcystin-dependent protein
MKKSTISPLLLLLVLAWAPQVAQAQPSPNPPGQISYQGFLTDAGGIPLATNTPRNYTLNFRIYDASTGGNEKWAEQQVVTVDRGYFTVMLGNGSSIDSNFTNNLTGVFSGASASDRYIGITVNELSLNEIAPRLRLLASPYAFLAQNAMEARQSFAVAGALTVSGTATVGSTMTASSFAGFGTVPIGGIIMWQGASVPSGWALCDGTGGTPDLRGRFVLGSGTGTGLTSRTPGQTGGEETHTLTTAEMPSHSHPTTVGTVGYTSSWNGSAEATRAPYQGRDNGDQTFPSASAGGGQAHNNMPPFYVLAYIMRVQ